MTAGLSLGIMLDQAQRGEDAIEGGCGAEDAVVVVVVRSNAPGSLKFGG